MNNFLNFTGNITECDSNKTWPNNQLKLLIKERTEQFYKEGLSSTDTAIIAHNKLPDFFIDIISLWNLGVCVAVCNPKITKNEISNITNFLSPSILIEKNKELQFKNNKNKLIEIKNSMDNKALILFTSGTTGEPKAVVHSFRSLISRITLNSVFINKKNLKILYVFYPFILGTA